MASKPLVYAIVAASLLGAGLLFSIGADRGEPGVSRRELDALRAEVSRISRRIDALAPSEDAPSEPLAEPAGELEGLRAEVSSLRGQVQALDRRPSDPDGAAYRGGPLESIRSEAQLAERLDDLLLRESEGGEARRFAAELAPRLRAALPHGASLREIRCRPSLCRVEMTYPDLDAYQEFVEAHLNGSATGAWSGPAFLVTTNPELERGDVIALAYLARDAHIFDPNPAQ